MLQGTPTDGTPPADSDTWSGTGGRGHTVDDGPIMQLKNECSRMVATGKRADDGTPCGR